MNIEGKKAMNKRQAMSKHLEIGLERVFGKHNQVEKWDGNEDLKQEKYVYTYPYEYTKEGRSESINSGLEKGCFPRLSDIWLWSMTRGAPEPEQQDLLDKMRRGKNEDEQVDIYNYNLDLFIAEKHIEGSDKISCQIYKTLQDNRAKGIKRDYIDIYYDFLKDWEEREEFSKKNS